MNSWVGVPYALAAAGAFSGSTALKHASTDGAPDPFSGGRTTAAFLVRTVRHPKWLTAIGLDVAGLTLQIIALHLGGLLLVQPLLVSGLIGAVLLRGRMGGRIRPGVLLWALALGVALAAFVLTLAGSGLHSAQPADLGPSLTSAGVVTAGVLIALGIARWRGAGDTAAATLGAAAGLTFAGAAALLTILTAQFKAGGVVALFEHPELYLLIVAGVGSQILVQTAFSAGPLTASAPATATMDVLSSVVLGVFVFDERIPHDALGLTVMVVSLAVVLVAAFYLTRMEAASEAPVVQPQPVATSASGSA